MPAKKSKTALKNKKSAKKPVAKQAAKAVAKNSSAKSSKKTASKAKKPVKILAKKAAPKLVKKAASKIVAKALKKPKVEKKIIAKKPEKSAKKPAKIEKIAVKATKKPEIVEKPVKEKIEKKAPEIVVKNEVKPAKLNFKTGEYAVYPSHGIGKITGIEHMKVLGEDFSCYLMFFEKEKLTIKIPFKHAASMNLRPLVSKSQMEEVFSILRSGIKKLKGMWSRRAQEYESKINSGDIILLAEVLRDLTRDIEDGERSYSERIIYETAVARLAAEYATIYNIDFEDAKARVVSTAKDKLGSEDKPAKRDIDFDYDDKDAEHDEEEEEDDEEDEEGDEDEDDDFDDDDDDDDRPKKRKK